MNLNPIEIKTNRLVLRGYSPRDMSFIFENYPKIEIMKMLGHRTEEEFQKEEYKHLNGYAAYNRSFLLFLLVEKSADTIIGRCGLHNWNIDHRRAEIGYDIADEKFKRNGFMTEAVAAILEYGFTQLNLHRIEALVGSNNIPSLKLMQKFTFVKEGVLREHYFNADKFEDSILFSKLLGEYTKEV